MTGVFLEPTSVTSNTSPGLGAMAPAWFHAVHGLKDFVFDGSLYSGWLSPRVMTGP